MIVKSIILPLLLGIALSAPGNRPPSITNHHAIDNPDYEQDSEEIIEPSQIKHRTIQHLTADLTDLGEEDGHAYTTPRPNPTKQLTADQTDFGEEDEQVYPTQRPNKGINFVGMRHEIVHTAGMKHTQYADSKDTDGEYDEDHAKPKQYARLDPVGIHVKAASDEKIIQTAAIEHKKYADSKELNIDDEYDEEEAEPKQYENMDTVGIDATINDKPSQPTRIKQHHSKYVETADFQEYAKDAEISKANKDFGGNKNIKFSQLAAIKDKIINPEGVKHNNVKAADPTEFQNDYDDEEIPKSNEDQGSSVIQSNFKVIQHAKHNFADSTTQGQGEVSEPTEPPSSSPAFEAFYPREAYGIPNSAARAPHGHATFYKYRNPALVDTKNAAAYGFRFDGMRRFNYD